MVRLIVLAMVMTVLFFLRLFQFTREFDLHPDSDVNQAWVLSYVTCLAEQHYDKTRRCDASTFIWWFDWLVVCYECVLICTVAMLSVNQKSMLMWRDLFKNPCDAHQKLQCAKCIVDALVVLDAVSEPRFKDEVAVWHQSNTRLKSRCYGGCPRATKPACSCREFPHAEDAARMLVDFAWLKFPVAQAPDSKRMSNLVALAAARLGPGNVSPDTKNAIKLAFWLYKKRRTGTPASFV